MYECVMTRTVRGGHFNFDYNRVLLFESYRTYARVCHEWARHVTYECGMSRTVRRGHFNSTTIMFLLYEPCRKYARVMSHMSASCHVPWKEAALSFITIMFVPWVMSHTCTSHVTHLGEMTLLCICVAHVVMYLHTYAYTHPMGKGCFNLDYLAYTCICMYLFGVCIHIYAYIHTRTHLPYVCMYLAYVCMYLHTYAYTNARSCIHTWMYLHPYFGVCMHVFVCIYALEPTIMFSCWVRHCTFLEGASRSTTIMFCCMSHVANTHGPCHMHGCVLSRTLKRCRFKFDYNYVRDMSHVTHMHESRHTPWGEGASSSTTIIFSLAPPLLLFTVRVCVCVCVCVCVYVCMYVCVCVCVWERERKEEREREA